MATRTHRYCVHLEWIGDEEADAAAFRRHDRGYTLRAAGKPPIAGSADPAFRGNPAHWNPEDLLVASLAACHKLWYLGLCAHAGIVVLAYEDRAEGTMVEHAPGGPGQFTEVVLRPRVIVAPGSDAETARTLHDTAHAHCFIARSVNFPVRHEAVVVIDEGARR
jgi:organic hydroperoxide reductase OsmC/OhrA